MDTSESRPHTIDPLVRAAQDGDRQALDALVERYERQVYRFGLSMCRDADDAQEVLQDTFLSMVRSLSTFRSDASLSTWLYAIAQRACLKRRRRRASAPREITSIDALSPPERESMADTAESPEDTVATRELRTALRQAIGSLEPAQRQVLLLRDVEGLTAPEAAEALGLTVAAVKSRLHRARLAVRSALTPVLGSPAPPHADGPHRDLLWYFSRHLEGDLPKDVCAAMEAHVDGCQPCRDACASLKTMLAVCRTAPPDLPLASREQLRQAIRACLAEARLSAQPR